MKAIKKLHPTGVFTRRRPCSCLFITQHLLSQEHFFKRRFVDFHTKDVHVAVRESTYDFGDFLFAANGDGGEGWIFLQFGTD